MNPPLKIAVCEDIGKDAKRLSSLIERCGYPANTTCFQSGEAFMESFAGGQYDLVFLDIYLGGMTGVDVAGAIRQIDRRIVIIFTTTSEDFTKEGYRLNAYKYLIKPLALTDVEDALVVARLKRDKAASDVYTVIVDGEAVKIPFDDIYFADVHGYKCLLHTVNGLVEVSTSIDKLEKLLPPPRFLRSHRSYIVNLNYVKDIDGDFIMANGEKAFIRVKDFRKMKAAYEDYIFEQA